MGSDRSVNLHLYLYSRLLHYRSKRVPPGIIARDEGLRGTDGDGWMSVRRGAHCIGSALIWADGRSDARELFGRAQTHARGGDVRATRSNDGRGDGWAVAVGDGNGRGALWRLWTTAGYNGRRSPPAAIGATCVV
ncbi:hypothetical protein GWI33_005559 [Rhynchophorus ferrugineus]|uniref:Uncharacterized protein n=1 Tax=Rhynchophorus ferrugineus TaxID=354439 RepID=A0A834IK90_RHYFE|nr:hypothetical protein GWI33_005559 [Rhynchophorus ferrugineus]